jgi:hypothetical protein
MTFISRNIHIYYSDAVTQGGQAQQYVTTGHISPGNVHEKSVFNEGWISPGNVL